MFRDRTFTWMFALTSVWGNLVLLGMGATVFLIAFLLVQLLLAVSLICRSENERLTKGAWITFCTILAGLAVSCCIGITEHILQTILILYVVETLPVCLGFFIVFRSGLLQGFRAGAKQKFQISLKELFVWTTLVAVWIAALRPLSHSSRMAGAYWIQVPYFVALTVLSSVLFDWRTTWPRRWSALVFINVLLSTLTILLLSELPFVSELPFAALPYMVCFVFIIQLYLAMGHAAQRIDRLKIREKHELLIVHRTQNNDP